MTELDRAAIREYRKQGLGYKKIAMKTGVSLNTVKSFCKRKQEKTSVCLQCRRPITQTKGRKTKKFCSDKCRMAWWNKHPEIVKRNAYYEYTCQACGKEFKA